MSNDVLIVGAGPSGLALAIALSAQGISYKLIDKNKGPGTASRAMVVQSRVLEFYRQYGFDDKIVEAGIPIQHFNVYKDKRPVGKLPIAKKGKGVSPYPYVLTLPQDIHEQILVEELEKVGGQVCWEHELISFDDNETFISATFQRPNGEEVTETFNYICGCDGASSTVRKRLDIGFPGGTYTQLFYVADVETNTQLDGASMGFHGNHFCVGFPIRTTEQLRLIGIIPEEVKTNGEPPESFKPLIPFAENILPIHIKNINWYSSYRSHHRVAEHFRVNRAFICGDAGHIHRPAGGQGMNTGISDAFNLAWKLSNVIQGKADKSILDTYEPERIEFAKKLVNTTDTGFKFMANSQVVKDWIIPYIFPTLLHLDILKKKLYKTISQTAIHYKHSDVSTGNYGNIAGGDCLPWIHIDSIDNFEPLKSRTWQIHIYGKLTQELKQFAYDSQLPIYHIPWVTQMSQKDIQRDAVFLVRPDGYISVATNSYDVEPLKQMIEKYHIKP